MGKENQRDENKEDETEKSFKRLERFRDYLVELKGLVEWHKYWKLREESKELDIIKNLVSAR